MKTLKILFVILTIGSISGIAQNDSLRYSQENGTLEKQRFIDQYDYVFMTKEPTKWMVKLGVTDVGGSSSLSNISATGLLGFEYKLSPSFSLGVNTGLHLSFDEIADGAKRVGIQIEGFSRWYYNMKRRIREGKSVNNFSGSYIGLDYSIENLYGLNYGNYPAKNTSKYALYYNNRSIGLSWGLQRRFFQHGWADFKISLNNFNTTKHFDVYSPYFYPNNNFELSTSWRLGLAFGDIKRKQSKIPACDVFKCMEEQKNWFKIRMPNLSIGSVTQTLAFGAAFEQKIGKSPFSISIENNSRFWGSTIYNEVISTTDKYTSNYINKYNYQFRNWSNLELRYYVLKKRQMAMGKSASNLSGVYVGLNEGFGWCYYTPSSSYNGNETYKSGFATNYWTAPLIGIQQRLFKNGFIDLKIGIQIKALSKGTSLYSSDSIPHNVTDLKLGFAF